MAEGREKLLAHLAQANKDAATFPISLATMWTYVTPDAPKATAMLEMLATMLNREPAAVAEQVLIGPPDECAAKLVATRKSASNASSSGPSPTPTRSSKPSCETSPR